MWLGRRYFERGGDWFPTILTVALAEIRLQAPSWRVGSWNVLPSRDKPVKCPVYFPTSSGLPLGLLQLPCCRPPPGCHTGSPLPRFPCSCDLHRRDFLNQGTGFSQELLSFHQPQPPVPSVSHRSLELPKGLASSFVRRLGELLLGKAEITWAAAHCVQSEGSPLTKGTWQLSALLAQKFASTIKNIIKTTGKIWIKSVFYYLIASCQC